MRMSWSASFQRAEKSWYVCGSWQCRLAMYTLGRGRDGSEQPKGGSKRCHDGQSASGTRLPPVALFLPLGRLRRAHKLGTWFPTGMVLAFPSSEGATASTKIRALEELPPLSSMAALTVDSQ